MNFWSLVGSFFNLEVAGLAMLAGFRRLGLRLKIVKNKAGELQAVAENAPSTDEQKTVITARDD